ncbi:hypothetical protein [Litoreibacter roseus]|uniref:Uncharacterized protein n=1 Tax=Litoreibacter roseus TaxID=2601869 RepID=A0A6N6JNG0_9RHOB|nr:hypothetical protein [Litoreibacter roseus]GFE66872.1 hypothetical protein KIN_39460 [Litoreibacter roseus]
MSDLDARLLAAHRANDLDALITLYVEAADCAPSSDAQAFYLTHAYVYALEIGDPRFAGLKSRLVAQGRDS